MIYSLFIGRWQPFHEGHKKLIQKVLEEGKNVCVAIRDTDISEENPYSAEERSKMISDAFPQVKVIVIPDIEEVVHGRKVGWGIRELHLDEKTEKVSGTDIRKEMKQGKSLTNSLYS
jgi:adenylylsulfate kinase